MQGIVQLAHHAATLPIGVAAVLATPMGVASAAVISAVTQAQEQIQVRARPEAPMLAAETRIGAMTALQVLIATVVQPSRIP